ncbi:Uncharacterised protein [Burkholderia pseudomallei]|nr:Uncharacterised protein [Burkholderia pseudomallei]
MRVAKRAHRALQHPRVRRRRYVPELDPPDFAALGERRPLAAAREMRERGLRFAEISRARGAQRDRAPRAVKEPHAEKPLRVLDEPRQRGRRDVELVRRAGEVQVPRDAEKRTHMAQFEAIHGWLLYCFFMQ